MTLFKNVSQGMAVGTTRIWHLIWFTNFCSLASSSSSRLVSCVILDSVAIEDSMECIPVLDVMGLVFSGQDYD